MESSLCEEKSTRLVIELKCAKVKTGKVNLMSPPQL
jgi:hypothetical protein